MEIIVKTRICEEVGISTDVMKSFLQSALDQLSEISDGNLWLEKLDAIIIPDDFGEELIAFQKEKGISEGFTENSYGTAVGKTLQYMVGDTSRFTIFLREYIMFGLFSEEVKQQSANVIHHELCHVHDDTIKERMLGLEFVMRMGGDFQTVLRLHADIIWSEFKATELSSVTKRVEEIQIEHVLKMVERSKPFIDDEIAKYRIHGEITALFDKVQLEASDLLKQLVYIIGDLVGKGWSDKLEMFSELINRTYLKEIWTDLVKELMRLNSIYEHWSGVEELDTLGGVVMKLWNVYGLYPNENWYISVPAVNPLEG
ncbi:hypothetical protein JJB07_14740 [Tumebacillus sp. ITR2]|uniref:Phage metallopeptidase domain-containing protein n=1 Tax=Tumebacillus amylolyticus TaxID=2801339 RepID=A0ABS1JC97_9BACL|nr:hypothetical protein [Tumebacillus amylolyticus]MBL0387896.1 hypothetical protein [Tumebacillus amylolyticus]